MAPSSHLLTIALVSCVVGAGSSIYIMSKYERYKRLQEQWWIDKFKQFSYYLNWMKISGALTLALASIPLYFRFKNYISNAFYK